MFVVVLFSFPGVVLLLSDWLIVCLSAFMFVCCCYCSYYLLFCVCCCSCWCYRCCCFVWQFCFCCGCLVCVVWCVVVCLLFVLLFLAACVWLITHRSMKTLELLQAIAKNETVNSQKQGMRYINNGK